MLVGREMKENTRGSGDSCRVEVVLNNQDVSLPLLLSFAYLCPFLL